MPISSRASTNKITFPLNDRYASENNDKPYTATIEINADQVKILLTSNDNYRADLTTVVEITNGLPTIHLSDAGGAEYALTITVNKAALQLCSDDLIWGSDDLIWQTDDKSNQATIFNDHQSRDLPGKPSNNNTLPAIMHATINTQINDRVDSASAPYSLSLRIDDEGITLELTTDDHRPNMATFLVIDRQMPSVECAANSFAEAAMTIYAANEGLHVCPKVGINSEPGYQKTANALRLPLDRQAEDGIVGESLFFGTRW